MEGPAEIEVVFGDTNHYRAEIDSFYTLLDEMGTVRASFTRYVQAALITASTHPGRCPRETLAPLYYRARLDGDRYRGLGRKFELKYAVVSRLHSVGETIGLTPDYRWKVNRVRGLYQAALVDYKEMRIAFFDQLASELRARGCNTEKLFAAGKDLPVPEIAALTSKPRPTKPNWRAKKPRAIVPASTATFFVDNSACDKPQDVYVDGILLGEVPANTRAAFQALAGRHSFCILEEGSGAECGAAGTVRTAHIHDGVVDFAALRSRAVRRCNAAWLSGENLAKTDYARTVTQSLADTAALAEQLVEVISSTEEEFTRMPIFVRPLLRRGINKRTGRTIDDWKKLAKELHRELLCAPDVGDAALALRDHPNLITGLERLADNYRTAPQRAARAMKGAALEAVTEAATRREAVVRSLVTALAGLRAQR